MINLPKKDSSGKQYVSYSQLSSWKRDKKSYIKQYFLGELFEGNAYTDFGSKVGEALEKGDFSSFSDKEVSVLQRVPRLDEFERKIELKFKDFYVMGFIDTNDKELTTLVDYKTGSKGKESEYDTEEYEQLAIYSAAIQQETGKLPKEAYVVLIGREGNAFKGEPLTLGDFVKTIPQDISEERVKKTVKNIEKTVKEISDYYRVFNLINVNVEV